MTVEALREPFNITAPSDSRHGLLRPDSISGIRGRRTSYLSSSLLNSDVAAQARWSFGLSKARITDIHHLENKAAKDPQTQDLQIAFDDLLAFTVLRLAIQIGTFHRLLSSRYSEESFPWSV